MGIVLPTDGAEPRCAGIGSGPGMSRRAHGVTSLDRVPASALVFAAMATIQLGSAAAVGRLFERIGPTAAMSARLVFAGLVLAALARRGVLEAVRANLPLVAAMTALLVSMNLTYYQAIDRLPLGVAAAIAMLGPLGVALLASRGRVDVALAVFAGVGVVLVTDADWGGVGGVGLLWSAGNALCFGTYVLLAERFGRALPGAGGIAVAMGLGGVLTLPIAVASAGGALFEPESLALALLLGALIGIPIMFEINALRRLPRRTFGVIICFEPVFAAVIGWVALSQSLSVTQVLGIVAIVVASAGATASAWAFATPE